MSARITSSVCLFPKGSAWVVKNLTWGWLSRGGCLVLAITLLFVRSAVAVQVLYTEEGDSAGATDRLTEDGSHDGAFTQTWSNNVKSASSNVYATNAMSIFGATSFRFNTTANYLHTIDIANATTLGAAFTLAAYVRPDFSPVRKRIFSTYAGEAAGVNQLIFDYGSDINGIRLLVNGSSIYPTSGEAVSIPAAVYSHLAATYDNGAVNLYVNGKLVKNGTSGSSTPIIDNNAGWRIQVGEDWTKGIAYQDQTVGFMDDILIYDRALTSNEIAQVAYYGAETFFSGHLIHPGILYTAEGDTTNATDQLITDSSQDGVFSSANVTVRTSNPKFGARAFNITPAGASDILDTIALPGTKELGERFTLAAYVDSTSVSKQRLFSSYTGGGAVGKNVLIFEFDPNGGTESFTMRFNHNSTLTVANTNFADGAYHHLAMTYDNGTARLYLDGNEVGSNASYAPGPVVMTYNLRVGEDWGSLRNEPLTGDVDEIVVLRKVLSPSEIVLLKEQGGQKFLAPPPPPPKGTLIRLE